MKAQKLIAASLVIGSCLGWLTQQAIAQNAPPLRILVGFPAGGISDVVARHLAAALQNEMKRPVVVENRPGAGGQIAAQALKAAAPDGNTLLLTNSHTVAMIPLTVVSPGFEPMKDFTPVAMVAFAPDVFVVSQAAIPHVNNLRDFSQWAKMNAGKGNVGVPAPGSAPDFAVKLISDTFAGDLRSIPYRGDVPVMQDVMAGQVAAGISSVGVALQAAKAGKIKIVAVNTPQRLALLPDVPTFAEQGVQGYDEPLYIALYAPVGVNARMLERQGKAVGHVVRSQAFSDKLAALGLTATSGGAADVNTRLKASRASFSTMLQQAGYQPQ